MIKVTVYWDTGKEEYVFDNEDDARAFYLDALLKCGQIKFSVEKHRTLLNGHSINCQ